ncbi:MAG TPA: hypothetical protein DEV93_01820 [Chloroflexi bacterium]|nr:hypothetical protein [Chloroflexota bacterium]
MVIASNGPITYSTHIMGLMEGRRVVRCFADKERERIRVMRLMRRSVALLAIPVALALTVSTSVAAAGSPTLFGAASYNAGGVQLISSTTVPPQYAGIDIPLPVGTTLNDISSLDATYQMTTGDCNVGSPRFSISLSPTVSIFVYFGDAPNYNCGTSPRSQPNLLIPFVDDSQVPGGTFYDTYAHALILAGTQQVTDLAVVLDGGWAGTQIAEISSLSVNNTVYNFAPSPPTNKEQCKKGGWATFINPAFKNQGDCVSFVATDGKNPPNG